MFTQKRNKKEKEKNKFAFCKVINAILVHSETLKCLNVAAIVHAKGVKKHYAPALTSTRTERVISMCMRSPFSQIYIFILNMTQ